MNKLDILVFAAHPDDVELACSGTVLKHISLGYKVGIVDLTKGELGTRGSATIRAEESKVASEILFEVFPIPTHQLLSIRTNANTENAHLIIHSVDGRILGEFNYQHQIDIANLSEGVYFLTMKSENKNLTVKFVKTDR